MDPIHAAFIQGLGDRCNGMTSIKCSRYWKPNFHEGRTLTHIRIIRIDEIRVTMTDDVTMTLLAYHIFTGYNSVNAFSSKRELSRFTLLKE